MLFNDSNALFKVIVLCCYEFIFISFCHSIVVVHPRRSNQNIGVPAECTEIFASVYKEGGKERLLHNSADAINVAETNEWEKKVNNTLMPKVKNVRHEDDGDRVSLRPAKDAGTTEGVDDPMAGFWSDDAPSSNDSDSPARVKKRRKINTDAGANY